MIIWLSDQASNWNFKNVSKLDIRNFYVFLSLFSSKGKQILCFKLEKKKTEYFITKILSKEKSFKTVFQLLFVKLGLAF